MPTMNYFLNSRTENIISHNIFLYSSFDPSPLVRHTVWTLILGGFMTSLTIYGGNQAMVQRYISMKNLKGAQTYVSLLESV
jgi:hypothetical protein